MPLRNPFERFGGWNPGGTYKAPNQFPNQNNELFGGARKNMFEGIFGDYSQPVESARAPEPATSSWDSYLTDLQDLYTKQGPARQAYSQHLDAMPEYKTPSKWNRFGAALVGAGEGWRSGAGAGFEAGQGAAMAPYKRELGEWATREKALGRSADLEDDATQRRISMMKEVRSASHDENQYRQTMRELDQKDAAQKDLARYRDAQIQNMKNSGWKDYLDAQGNQILYHPGTNETRNMGPTVKKTELANEGKRIGISQGQLGVAQGQLGVAQGNLAVNQAGETRRATSAAAGVPVPANQSSNARGSAMSRAAAESMAWSKFIGKDGNIDMNAAAKNPAEYKKYLARVDELEQGILTRRIPGSAPIIDYDPER
jgi:hypothetical protein